MSPTLTSLLLQMRQHPGFPELLKAVEEPRQPHYRKSKGLDLQTAGAELVYSSGALDQHKAWIALLTGRTSQETNS